VSSAHQHHTTLSNGARSRNLLQKQQATERSSADA
jgi:hypothetical protein